MPLSTSQRCLFRWSVVVCAGFLSVVMTNPLEVSSVVSSTSSTGRTYCGTQLVEALKYVCVTFPSVFQRPVQKTTHFIEQYNVDNAVMHGMMCLAWCRCAQWEREGNTGGCVLLPKMQPDVLEAILRRIEKCDAGSDDCTTSGETCHQRHRRSGHRGSCRARSRLHQCRCGPVDDDSSLHFSPPRLLSLRPLRNPRHFMIVVLCSSMLHLYTSTFELPWTSTVPSPHHFV